MPHQLILTALFAAAILPSQAASDFTNPLNTYLGNSQENGNGAAQPVFLAGNPLADPVIPHSGLEANLIPGFTATGAWQTIFFRDSSAATPEVPGVKFGQNQVNSNNGRNYMRTVAADYFTQDFTAFITVRRPALDANNRRSVFFGLGTGALAGNTANPDAGTNNASAYIELQNGFGNASRKVQSNGPTTVELAFPAMTTVSDDSMRLRMQWNSVARTIAYSIDYAYVPGDAFVADQTFPSNVITTQFNEWAGGDRSSIFFGGDRSVVFTDLVIDVNQPATPPTPTGLTVAGVSDGSVSLSWSAFAIPGTTYSVYRRESSGSHVAGSPLATGLTTTTYTDATAVNGTPYFYVVTQTNTVAVTPESAFSNEVTATAVAGAIAPAGLVAANSGAGQILLDWSDLLSPFTVYNVYRASDAGGPFTFLAATGTVSQYRDTAATSGTTFYYHVKSTLDAQESDPSNVSSAVSGAVEIFVDFNQGSASAGRGVLTTGTAGDWNNVAGGDSVSTTKLNDSSGIPTSLGIAGSSNFIFATGAGANVGGNPATLTGNDLSTMADYRFSDGFNVRGYTFSGLPSNRTYDLYLFGYGGGVDQNSGFRTNGIAKQTADPTGLTTLTETRHYVTFTVESDANGALTFDWSGPANLGLTDVQAGSGSGFNGFQLVENASAVLQPQNPGAFGTLAAVEVSWDSVAGADSYKVYRSTTRATGYTLLADAGNNTSYNDTSAVPGTPYFYVVTAVDANVESFFSAEAIGTRELPLIVDADLDGLSDSDEALIGTNPNSAADFFVAPTSTATPNTGNFDVAFTIKGAPGTYVIERSTTLAEGSWTEIPASSQIFTWNTGTVLDHTLNLSAPGLTPASGGKEFFRAKGVAAGSGQ